MTSRQEIKRTRRLTLLLPLGPSVEKQLAGDAARACSDVAVPSGSWRATGAAECSIVTGAASDATGPLTGAPV